MNIVVVEIKTSIAPTITVYFHENEECILTIENEDFILFYKDGQVLLKKGEHQKITLTTIAGDSEILEKMPSRSTKNFRMAQCHFCKGVTYCISTGCMATPCGLKCA